MYWYESFGGGPGWGFPHPVWVTGGGLDLGEALTTNWLTDMGGLERGGMAEVELVIKAE